MDNKPHQAVDSYVGYEFQGQFALILLLDAKDGEAVSVETQDDVVLEGNITSLYQLKHSLKEPDKLPRLTITNVGFWKTIFIWADGTDIFSKKFIFVTSAAIAPDCSLQLLREHNGNRTKVVTALDAEANRVLTEVQVARAIDKKYLPHKDRLPGCEAYLKLTLQQRTELVNRITIDPENFNALQIQNEVEVRLTNVPLNMKAKIAERLIEWWDY